MGKPASGMAAAKKEQIWRDHFGARWLAAKASPHSAVAKDYRKAASIHGATDYAPPVVTL